MHTGSTDNYELTQFASTDKPAWLVDYNEDMRKIDAGMKSNADAIAELGESIGQEGEDITSLKERMATAEQEIDTVEEKIGVGELETEAQALIAAANELLGLIRDNDGDITQLQQSIAGIGESITGLSQLAYTIANVYDSAQTYEVGDYAIYQNTLYKCVTAITVGEAFDPAKWTSVKVMNEIPSGGGGGDTVYAEDVVFNNEGTHLQSTNVQDVIIELDEEGHKLVGELQTATLATGETTVTLNYTQSIGTTTMITPVCSAYGISPTEVTYTANSITMTFETQDSDITVGARIQSM